MPSTKNTSLHSYGELNMSLLTNLVAIAIIALGFVSPYYPEQIKNTGFYALSGAITNWLAIHMLFEKVPGLYGSGVIPNKFREFKEAIRSLLMNQFFSEAQLNKFFNTDSAPSFELSKLVEELDFEPVFFKLMEALESSPLATMLQMFGGTAALEPLKESFLVKIKEALKEMSEEEKTKTRIKSLISSNLSNSSVKEQIREAIDQRLDELTPLMVKDILQDMIRKHLGWLVVWGGLFGALIGLLVSFL